MDYALKQDLDRYFSVFRGNAKDILHQMLPPDPAVLHYQAELDAEIARLRATIMSRLERSG